MAAPISDTPDPPPLPPAAVTEARRRFEALDLPEVGMERALSRRLQKTLPPSFEEDPTRSGEESSDEEYASCQSDESLYNRRRRGRSLSPLSIRNLRSSDLLSSTSSSESLSSPSSSASRSRQHRPHTRSSLHARRTQTRSRSDNRRSYPHYRRNRGRPQRRRWYVSEERSHPSIPDENERETLKSRLAHIAMIITKNPPLKQKHHRYFQKKGTDFAELKESWEKSKCKIHLENKPLSPREEVPSMPQVLAQMQENTREPPHLHRHNSGTMTPEYRSFRKNHTLLHDTIATLQSIPRLCAEMWAKGLISQAIKDEVTQEGDFEKSIQRLLNALGHQVSTNAAHFHTFLEILQEDTALHECCRQMKEDCRLLEPLPDDYAAVISPTEKYAEHLKEVYLRGRFPQKWPETTMTKFIKLIITEEKNHRSISMQDIFQDEGGGTVSRVLVKGGPGIGKSTFALELCRMWGRGELQQFSLVILLPLCYQNVRKAKNISGLIHTYCNDDEEQKAIVRAIDYSEGDGALLILEGFNELPITEETKETWDFLLRLFAGTVLPKAAVLVTTRSRFPAKYGARVVQIDGFGEDEVHEYIKEAGLSGEQQSNLNKYLFLNPDILKMVYNPLHCAILVKLYQAHGKETSSPKTSTQLFSQLVKSLVLRYMDEKGKLTSLKCGDFPKCLPRSEYHEYNKLCELAHEKFVEGQSEFGLSEKINHFNLMQESVKPFEANVTYRFLHQSLQEFLTASWILEHYSPEEQFKLLREHLSNPSCYEHILQFLAGLSITLNWEELAKYAFVDRGTLDVASFYLDNDIQGVQLPFLSWLFENQNTNVCAQVLGKGIIGYYSKSHATPLDYHALAYCIANSECKWEVQIQLPSVNWLDTFSKSFKIFQAAKTYNKTCGGTIQAIDIGHCQISEVGWNLLFSDSENPLQSLRQLILYDTVPPTTLLQHFPDYLPKLEHLQCLALSKTPLGKGGAVSLMEILPKTEISELHLCKTGIGFHDCQALAPYLSDPQCKLRSVDISYNSLTKESVNVITSALICNASLTKLSLSGSEFSPKSFSTLVSRLEGTLEGTPLTVLHLQRCVLPQGSIDQLCTKMAADEKCALQSLGLGYNQLNLSEVEALATMLETNNSLIFLYLKSCSISATGFSALSSSLHNNTMLCELSLSGNELSQENVNAVCQGFFSEARFACDNIPNMPVPPLLCLDSCPDEWKTAIIENASEYLQTYYFFQEAQIKHLKHEKLPDIKEFMEVTSNIEQKREVCSHYIHFGEHDPSCGRDRIEEMRPSYVT